MQKILLALFVALGLSSCATLFKGDTATVTFTSNPSQANVLIDGNSIGQTTIQARLKTNRSYNITFQKAGFANQTFMLTNKVGALWIILDVLGGLVPLIVDASTGAWYEFDTNNVNVVLTPQAMSKEPLPSWALKVMKSRGLVIGQTAQ
jgi:uncharacterized protein YceK